MQQGSARHNQHDAKSTQWGDVLGKYHDTGQHRDRIGHGKLQRHNDSGTTPLEGRLQ